MYIYLHVLQIFQRIKPIWNLVVCGDEETIKTSFIVVGPMNKRQASTG